MKSALRAKGRRELLRRIVASPHFAHADSLKMILEYLMERTRDPDASPVKEYEIAVSAIGRSQSFDPKTDPIVRVSMAGIRGRLHAYFEDQGRHEPLRLSIPKGQYRLVFTESRPEERAGGADVPAAPYLRRFWNPYLVPGAHNVLVFTELLFFRDNRGNYVRNIYVNDLATGASQLQERMPELGGGLKPSFHFLSAGEIHTLLSVSHTLQELGARLEMRNSRFISWADLHQSNLILLGSSRTNSFLDSLQGSEPFVITTDEIRNTSPRSGEPAAYRGRRFLEGKLERVVEYAVVTRRTGMARESVVTMIAANHGRAIEGAGQFVTREDKLRDMMRQAGLKSLPEHFQLLLRIEMVDFDEQVCGIEYVTHRVVE